jgi:superfamily II DNA or RNA helicase
MIYQSFSYFIDDYLNVQNKTIITVQYDNTPRYLEQQEIVKACKKQTTIVKAPAGFGKTIIGLLWGLRNNKKIWVTHLEI